MNAISNLNKFEAALDAVSATPSSQTKMFVSEAFDAIELHRERNVQLKVILAEFNAAYGVSIRLPRFRQLLKAERDKRSKLASDPLAKKDA